MIHRRRLMNLDEKSPSPSNSIMNESPKNTPQCRTGSVREITATLHNTSFSQRDQIRSDNGRNGCHPSSSGTSNDPSSDHDVLVFRQTARESPDPKEDMTYYQS